LLVMELTRPLPNVEVLIGLDILLGCLFLIEGPARRFSLGVTAAPHVRK
jgi:hypothetical protein